MKLLLLIVALFTGLASFGQNCTIGTGGSNSATPVYDLYNTTFVGFTETTTPVCIHPNLTTLSDSGYVWQPVYGVGVFSSATTATVTTTAIKANSIVQIGWYGNTVPAYSVTASVPTSSITPTTSFVVKASVSNSDSFYYLIFNHN
jgi:hypothetical protein